MKKTTPLPKDNYHYANYPVSIIIPVYGVAAFIERCAVSLFEQDFDTIEYIFIDDASPDNSITILQQVIERYPNRSADVKIIRHQENQGAFEAKKQGLLAATGEYVIYVDSDDWVETNMISTLLSTAKAENADVVACDYYLEMGEITRYKRQSFPQQNHRILSAVLKGYIGSELCFYLSKRKVYAAIYRDINMSKHINMGDDVLLAFPLPIYAERIIYLPRAFYHYNRENSCSITKTLSPKCHADMIMVCKVLYDILLPRIDNEHFDIFKERAALYILSSSLTTRQKPDKYFLQQLNFNLINLWTSELFSLKQRLVYSFYFLSLPVVPVVLQTLRAYFQSIFKGSKFSIAKK